MYKDYIYTFIYKVGTAHMTIVWPYFLPFLKDAENPFVDLSLSEWNFTNILFPEDLIVFGNALPQSLFPNSGDAASLPSLTST